MSAEAGHDLQGLIRKRFRGRLSGIPPTVLLRRARTSDERMQAFRLKVLGKLRGATCSNGEVTLAADNGTVRFHVDKSGLMAELHARIATTTSGPDIEAAIKLTPRAGERMRFSSGSRFSECGAAHKKSEPGCQSGSDPSPAFGIETAVAKSHVHSSNSTRPPKNGK